MESHFLYTHIIFPTYNILNNYKKYERYAMQEYRFEQILDRGEVAMAYVPWQHLTYIYENLDEALMVGTIFPELNKPFEGRRCIQ